MRSVAALMVACLLYTASAQIGKTWPSEITNAKFYRSSTTGSVACTSNTKTEIPACEALTISGTTLGYIGKYHWVGNATCAPVRTGFSCPPPEMSQVTQIAACGWCASSPLDSYGNLVTDCTATQYRTRLYTSSDVTCGGAANETVVNIGSCYQRSLGTLRLELRPEVPISCQVIYRDIYSPTDSTCSGSIIGQDVIGGSEAYCNQNSLQGTTSYKVWAEPPAGVSASVVTPTFESPIGGGGGGGGKFPSGASHAFTMVALSCVLAVLAGCLF